MHRDRKQPRFIAACNAFACYAAAIILVLSFLGPLVTIGEAALTESELMSCCIGGAGHESGNCDAGLTVESPNAPAEDGELLCGLRTTRATVPLASRTHEDVVEADHCSSSEAINSDKLKTQNRTTYFQLPAKPCSSECGACTSAFSRRPRSREHVDLPLQAKMSQLPTLHLLRNQSSHARVLTTTWRNIQPRAPPTLSI
jgi:hypothetical protein